MRSTLGLRAGTALVVCVLAAAAIVTVGRRQSTVTAEQTVRVTQGPLAVTLVESGTLKASDASVYRLPIGGRELEITELAPEGLLVQEGDLVVQFETAPLERELAAAEQALRQATVDADSAQSDAEDAAVLAEQTAGTQSQMELDEATATADLAERRAGLVRREYENLSPLLATGYVTRNELERVQLELDAAEAASRLAAKRLQVMRDELQPRARRQATLRLGRQRAAHENALARREESKRQVDALREALDALSLFARAPGIVVYGDLLGASPRRKVRVGDRVTATQTVSTIPDLRAMRIETSVAEVDVRSVKPGQRVTAHVEAFPDVTLSGVVRAIGSMASASAIEQYAERRFEVLVDLDRSELPLRPDMSARVVIHVEEVASTVLVPSAALAGVGAERSVRVLINDRLERRLIRVGLSDRSVTQVVTGLVPGEHVAIEPTDDGEP